MINILVVDDERLNLKVAEAYLQRMSSDYEVFLCQNPLEVEKLVVEHDIDIVLLDIIMPIMNGTEVIEQLRKNYRLNDVQIIILTSLSDAETFKICFDRGADDYLKKPIDVTELQARLKAAVNTRNNAKILQKMYQRLRDQNSELKQLNKVIKEAQFQMIQKEKLASIGELAAGVAHEINNPLGYVGSNIETMNNFAGKIKQVVSVYRKSLEGLEQLGLYHKEGQVYFTNVREAERKFKFDFVMEELNSIMKDSGEGIDRISKIVQTLKSFARTGIENDTVYNNLNSIIEDALLIVKNEAKYTIDIETHFEELPELECNRGQLGQVILNILVNAIQAIKAQDRSDRGRIIILTESVQDAVFLKIMDDGPGIPEQVLGKIFDPFFTTKDVGEGTGLGLSISHDIIVNKHNGMITAGNRTEGGAWFYISIPLKKKEEMDNEINKVSINTPCILCQRHDGA
ncbi:response regulator [Desulfosporosinus sp. BICA1-9]|uniref:hybrid sensor histidine kinase/response regulator n=1 Tax=Desulfosporosinus sp. BICA1-9 TaxID=1531958 RepID=UPI00061EF6ED|nr:response regulator [Desulfosporosinus sp. BICA1-9]KJS47106.1 MAG: hypothetical protein VR66_21370 [Peptococcaceae bacterium BRH_c23]HBW39028.1 hybrid sensor histidine kinase/response regulator [Desulfosporosinus sp.]